MSMNGGIILMGMGWIYLSGNPDPDPEGRVGFVSYWGWGILELRFQVSDE